MSLFLCMVWECVLTSLIYTQLSDFSSTTCWRDCLFPIFYSCLLRWRLMNHSCVSVFLGSLFCSIDPCCLFLCWYHTVFLIFYFVFEFSRLTMLWLFQEDSRGTQSHIPVSILPQTPLPSGLPQSIGWSSLCCAVGPCWCALLCSEASVVSDYLWAYGLLAC